MPTIKVKEIEGEIQDINRLFDEQHCDFSKYIGAEARSKCSVIWIWISITVFFAVSCLLWTGCLRSVWTKVLILSVFASWGVVVSVIYFKYRIIWLTVIVAIAGFAIVAISIGVYSPGDVTKKIENVAQKKLAG